MGSFLLLLVQKNSVFLREYSGNKFRDTVFSMSNHDEATSLSQQITRFLIDFNNLSWTVAFFKNKNTSLTADIQTPVETSCPFYLI